MPDIDDALQGIGPFLAQYPPELDQLVVELRFVHPWKINRYSRTGQNVTFPIHRRIADMRAAPGEIGTLISKKAAFNCLIIRNPLWGYRLHSCSKQVHVACLTSFLLDIEECLPEEALGHLERTGLPPPSLAVCSGNGTHAYYFVRPLTASAGKDIQRRFVETATARLPELHVDQGCLDLGRCSRLTPSINFKDTAADDRAAFTAQFTGQIFNLSDLLNISNREAERALLPLPTEQEPLRAVSLGGRKTALAKTERLYGTPPVASSSTLYPPYPPPPCTVLPEGHRRDVVHTVEPEWIDALIDRHPILGRNTGRNRNREIARLVADIRKSYPTLTMSLLKRIHDRWLLKYRDRTSGTSVDESFGEFRRCWLRMPEQFRTHEEWIERIQRTLRQHPGHRQIPASKRNDNLRKAADFTYTASASGSREFPLSERVLAKALKIKPKAAHDLLTRLRELHLLVRVSVGDRKSGKASVYRMPQEFVADEGERHRTVPDGTSGSRTNPDAAAPSRPASEASDA